ncbi:MAG TPA: PQQ-dependent sugar dehydrogenase [Rhodanobacteraceae bacterium]|nr:PQQ-dependent sugar dehydrogenase [Rhodanobacteraceae bacterium]
MPRSLRAAWLVSAGLASLAGATSAAPPLHNLKVPAGFHVSIYSDRVPDAREMALGTRDTVFVGSMREGKVYALTGMDRNGRAEHVYVIAKDLEMPVGVAFHDGALYVSAVSRILEYPGIEAHLADPPQPVVVTDKLPGKTHHGWKFIAFGPDGKLYVPIGAPCNICNPGPDFAKIIRMNADGSAWQTIATGIRNSVGFDWQPGTHAFWFTNNGRDLLGDDEPDDTLNRVDKPGENFGYPYCHAGNVADPQFGKGHSCSEFAQPALRLGAHVASLACAFTWAGCSRPRTKTRFSSPNTVHGTVHARPATVWWQCTLARMARSRDRNRSSPASWMDRPPWDAPPTCSRCATAACWFPMTTTA